jgi:hypothetical protein
MYIIRPTRSTPAVQGVVTIGNCRRTYVLVEASSFVERAVAERRPLHIPFAFRPQNPRRVDAIALALASMFILSLVAAYLRL